MNDLEKQLLNDFQRDFPLTPRPFAVLADQLGVSEQDVLDALRQLSSSRKISRVGPVFAPRRAGVSTLAAIAVPPERLEEVAAVVSAYPQVNHNYEREHRFNLWFVATAADQTQLDRVIADIERSSGLPVMTLPLIRDYHIDLGFRMQLV